MSLHTFASRGRLLLCSAALCVFSLQPSRLPAQVVRGVVLDSITSGPLKGINVELLSPQSIVGKAVSSDSGRFAVRVPASGPYRFRVRQIGYYDYITPAIPIDASRDASITLRLASLPVALEPIAISASSQMYLQNIGFYERKKSDPGYFMMPDEVQKQATKAHQTADILDGIPGVTLTVAGGSKGIRIPLFTGRTGTECEAGPNVYLDGHLVNPSGMLFDINDIQPADMLAIELYRHVSEVPLKFGGSDAVCGAIVIWTKH